MPKVIIIYESKWGNTRLVAETIVEGMSQAGGIETTLSELKQVNIDRLADTSVPQPAG